MNALLTPLLEKLYSEHKASPKRDFFRTEKLKRLLELTKGRSNGGTTP